MKFIHLGALLFCSAAELTVLQIVVCRRGAIVKQSAIKSVFQRRQSVGFAGESPAASRFNFIQSTTAASDGDWKFVFNVPSKAQFID